jgi:hypothetical protein
MNSVTGQTLTSLEKTWEKRLVPFHVFFFQNDEAKSRCSLLQTFGSVNCGRDQGSVMAVCCQRWLLPLLLMSSSSHSASPPIQRGNIPHLKNITLFMTLLIANVSP